MVVDMSYMKIGASLSRADWLLECLDADSNVKRLPCHSIFIRNVSSVLLDIDETAMPESDGRKVIAFPGDEKRARAFLGWLYDQQRPLAKEEVIGLVRISHEWNIGGLASTCAAYLSKNKNELLRLPSLTIKPDMDGLEWALLADECKLTEFWQDCKKFIVLHTEVMRDKRICAMSRDALHEVLVASIENPFRFVPFQSAPAGLPK